MIARVNKNILCCFCVGSYLQAYCLVIFCVSVWAQSKLNRLHGKNKYVRHTYLRKLCVGFVNIVCIQLSIFRAADSSPLDDSFHLYCKQSHFPYKHRPRLQRAGIHAFLQRTRLFVFAGRDKSD